MGPQKDGVEIVHVDYGPLVSPRNALRFGHMGGCVAGCENCLYIKLCEGGEIGSDELGGEDGRGQNATGERAT